MASYTPASSFLSAGRFGEARWAQALAAHGADLPGRIVGVYHDRAADLGLNPDLALAQAVEETAWFTSPLWLTRRNPCGLGITGPGVLGLDYGPPEAGIGAHLAHLCCYVYDAHDCPVDHGQARPGGDPRHTFHDGNPALSHLQEPPPGRRWAEGPNYVAHILAVLAVVGEGAQGTGGTTMAYSKRQQIVKAGMPNRPGNPLNGNGVATAYTIHNTANPNAGANAAMHANYVGQGGGPDSSSYHDVADDKEVVNLIPYNEAAFHIGDWSTGPGWISSYGIEICENAGIDFPQACRNAARAVAERMIADGHAGEYTRVRKHGDWWTPQHPQVHKDCPARLLAGWQGVTWEVFMGMVKAATEQLTGATKVPVPPSGDPGFPGALQPDGSSRLNDTDFGGTLVRVEWVQLGGINAAGERYSRRWSGHKLEDWVRTG